ncbi:TVP38/TMEM64 family protein [Halobellus marinus]|uniref:TVP38/TMEM64 family protein n=1 Tax=Halobellus TaxID=1073986 RepID=UPI0028AF3F21|nr:TVP38/TMEM64 family protein [Halobellus sp. DFY28]
MTDSTLDRIRAWIQTTQIFASERSRRRFLRHLMAVTVGFVAVILLLRSHLSFLTDTAALRTFIRSFGIWAPIALIVLQALQVVVAPVPGQILAVVAGYLFGPWWGTLYNMIGITLGSAAAFWLSRLFGRAYVEGIVDSDALSTFDSISDRYVRVTLFLFFLIPGLPDDVICFAGGLTKLPLWQLILLAVVGRAPAFFLANVVGGLLGTDQFAAAAVVAAAVLFVSALGYLNRDRILRRFGGE